MNQLSLADFRPDLALLDAVMTSLRVEPDVELRRGETAISAAKMTSSLVAPPPGLVYRMPTDGLWRVDASGQPQLLTDRWQRWLLGELVGPLLDWIDRPLLIAKKQFYRLSGINGEPLGHH